MIRKMKALTLLAIFSCVATPVLSAGQPGITDTVFNKKFIYKLKPMMPLDQLAKIIGTEGQKVGEEKRSSPSTIRYHWSGGRESALDIKVAAGKVVDVTVTAPKKQKFSLGKNGELVELGN